MAIQARSTNAAMAQRFRHLRGDTDLDRGFDFPLDFCGTPPIFGDPRARR
jgi:hypothetical protein